MIHVVTPDDLLDSGTPLAHEPARTMEFWKHPPGWPSAITCAVCSLWATWAYSVPGTHFFSSILALWAWAIVCVAWLVRAGVAVLLVRRRVISWRWAMTPIAAVVAVLVVTTDASFEVRYRLSRPAMDDVATDVVGGQRQATTISRIGLWRVERVERIQGGMRFLVRGTGFLDPYGFAFSPTGRPPAIGEDFYEHLDGPWYVWRESW